MPRLLLPLLLAVLSLWPRPAVAEQRLALVVGNDLYESLPHLGRARADADAVAGAMRGIGFEVILEKDASRRTLNRRLADLEARINSGDTVFFFFAGHGVAIDGENVLLPVDVPRPRTGEEALVREEGFIVDGILDRIQRRGALTTFLVLDACRDNPFAAEGTRSIGQNRGLARIDTPKGVFVLFSAGIGQTALDALSPEDNATNSVFTRHLVPLLQQPGLTHVDLAKRVQASVDKLAASVGHQQQPAYYDQIVGEFVLNTMPVPPDEKAVLAEAAEAWPAIETSSDKASIEDFIDKYGKTPFGALARGRLALLTKPEETAPTVEVVPEPVESDPKLVARDLQKALTDKSCYAGEIDGAWGAKSAAALEAFNVAAGTTLAAPTSEAVDAVTRSATKCAVAAIEEGVDKTTGEAVSPPDTSGAKPATPRKAKAAAATKRKSGTRRKKSGGNCFTFEGQTVCD
jgi:hypothetical protein